MRWGIEQLELAKGHDGILRGAPEPAIVVGLYRVDASGAVALGRYLYRFERPDSLPTKVGLRERSKESIVFAPGPETRIAVIALAVEEDSGRGLQTLFAELENGEAVVAWLEQQNAAMPMHLPDLTAGGLPPDTPHRVQLMFGDHDPSKNLRGDDWIGAALVWTTSERARHRHRLRFVSDDTRNDWTAELDLTIGTA